MTAPGLQALDREALFVALFTRLQTITSPAILNFSRKLYSFEEALAAEQPALYLVKGPEENMEPNRSLPPKWKLRAEVYIFCRNDGDPAAAPSTQLNQLITGLEGALLRKPTEGFVAGQPYAQSNEWWTSLDGLCSHVWIADTVLIGEGTNGDQAVAVVPLEIFCSP